MNRYEVYLAAILLIVGIVFVIKSKWFEDKVNWLLRGTKSTTVNDLKEDKRDLDKAKVILKKDLTKTEAAVKKDQQDLSTL